MPDYDPRIVDLYDEDNPDGPDHDFYRALADEVDAKSVLDLGCGTGILTVTLARNGRRVVGVDPSGAMLDYARQRPSASHVEWIHGDSTAAPAGPFDLILLTGNVAQHIRDPDWEQTLQHVRAVSRPGTKLAFETRNPAARAWLEWAAAGTSTRDTMHGKLTESYEVEERADGEVLLRAHNVFADTQEDVVDELVLTFRDRERIASQLQRAGFAVDVVWGSWSKQPFTGPEQLMIIEASAL